MKSQNLALLSAKFVAKDLVGDILYFPVWWYSVGLVKFIKRRLHSIASFEESIGLTVWILNWAKPMYGQYDIAGKIISFIFRTIGIFWKGLELMFYLVLSLIMLLVWLGLPILVVYEFYQQIF
ncbi:MAG: hypothetical protein WC480_03345 [Patescibacteria group bacterium]